MLIVPDELNRNSPNVRKAGDPADTGAAIINYMCERIGIENLANSDVLDVGCGVRFCQAFLNRNLPVGSYTGLEVERKIVEFLNENISDERFSIYHINTKNNLYNPKGNAIDMNNISYLPNKLYDIICMFSVITHQNPVEAHSQFAFLRRYVKSNGHLFFTAITHDNDDLDFEERNPQKPGAVCSYSQRYLVELVEKTGWSVLSIADPLPGGVRVQTSFLCEPAR